MKCETWTVVLECHTSGFSASHYLGPTGFNCFNKWTSISTGFLYLSADEAVTACKVNEYNVKLHRNINEEGLSEDIVYAAVTLFTGQVGEFSFVFTMEVLPR